MRDRSFAALCRARDLLAEPRDAHLSIADIARDASMSPFHFIRRFEAMFGETPHQYRINARLDRAKRLLAIQDYSVTRVCLEVGFASLGSFSDLFARRVGVAPTVYRRQVRSLMTVPRVMPPVLTPGCLTLMVAAFAIFEKAPDLASGTLEGESGGGAPSTPVAREEL